MAHPRIELRKKVEERQKQLKQALAAIAGDEKHLKARREALGTDLLVVENALRGGWQNVSEVGAAELTRWLESTTTLVTPPARAQARRAK